MKIGILTFHNSRNYGAVLQAYGLREVLRDMGYQVDVIDYRSPALEKRKRPFTFKSFVSNPIKFIQLFLNIYYDYRVKVRNFTLFEKQFLHVTNNQYYPEDIKCSDYDAIIVGSDQVWSPIITGGPDAVYWGRFKPVGATLITYGASSGSISTLETEEFKEVDEWLKQFDFISVREERLKKYVESHSSKRAEVVVDPTILAGRTVFEGITSNRVIKEPYILLYRVESTPYLLSITKKVAELYHAKLIIRIGSNGLSSRITDMKNGMTYINASVPELLSLVKYAECVVALSFHGTALSLLYEKDFFSVRGKNMARVESVLMKCNLMDRIIDYPEDVVIRHIDYNSVKPFLADMRRKSLDWLRKALTSI